MQDEIIEVFKKLKEQLDFRDYDDERFIKDLPENEPVSLVIPFERTGRGYLDIFRSYIGGGDHPNLSDEELLKQYLESPEGKKDNTWGDISMYKDPKWFIGYIETLESGSFTDLPGNQKNRFSDEEISTLVEALRKKKINAVSKSDEKSQDPSTVVVMSNGIITPFMDKKTTDCLVPKIKEIMSKCGFAVGGHIAPVNFKQLRTPFKTEQNPMDTDFMRRFISDFLNKPCANIEDIEQLMGSKGKIKVNSDVLRSIDTKNEELGRPYIWRGDFGCGPFTVNIDTESKEAHALRKSWAMATPSIEYAKEYSRARNFISDGNRLLRFGFLYQYKSSGEEVYFADRGIERTPTIVVLKNRKETVLFPCRHLLKNIFFYHSCDDKSDEHYLMRLDPNDPMHKKLLELCGPRERKLSGNLLQRRINQFNEAAENGGQPCVYDPQIAIELQHTLSQCSRRKEETQGKNSKGKFSVTQQATLQARLPQNG